MTWVNNIVIFPLSALWVGISFHTVWNAVTMFYLEPVLLCIQFCFRYCMNSKFTSSVYTDCYGRILLTLYSTYIERKNNSELKVESDFITQYSSCMSFCDFHTDWNLYETTSGPREPCDFDDVIARFFRVVWHANIENCMVARRYEIFQS